MTTEMLFDNWGGLARVLIIGTAAYASLVVMLRLSGNRTLSKMNAFDFIVTVALGSTLATVLLSKSVPLLEGVLALLLLVSLQFAVTWLSVRSPRFSSAIKAEPVLIVYHGQLLYQQMRRARVIEDEVLAAVRGQGLASLAAVEAMLLETDGSFNVVSRSDRPPTALANIAIPDSVAERKTWRHDASAKTGD